MAAAAGGWALGPASARGCCGVAGGVPFSSEAITLRASRTSSGVTLLLTVAQCFNPPLEERPAVGVFEESPTGWGAATLGAEPKGVV